MSNRSHQLSPTLTQVLFLLRLATHHAAGSLVRWALPAFMLAALASGCASILNGDSTSLRIRSRPSGATVRITGDTASYLTPFWISRPRSPDDLHLHLRHDTLNKRIVIPAELSTAFWLNLYPGFWPGFLVDLNSNRRYGYDPEVYVDLSDSSSDYSTWNIFEEPKRLRLSAWLSFFALPLPDIASHLFEAGGAHHSRGSINAVGLMALYSPSRSDIFMLSAEARTTVIGECFEGCYGVDRSTLSVSLLAGRQWIIAWLAGGVHTTFSEVSRGEPVAGSTEAVRLFTRTAEIGPALNGAVRLSEAFWIVAGYQPSLFEFDRMRLLYTHQVSLSLRGVW